MAPGAKASSKRSTTSSKLAGVVGSSHLQKRSNRDLDNNKFWSSDTALLVYAFIALSILTRRFIFLHGISLVILREMYYSEYILSAWIGYCADDREARLALKALQNFLRQIVKESERAVSGDKSRLIAAGYLYYNLTAPGESYIGYIIRSKMSLLNNQLIEEIQEWREKRLGYKRSAS